MTFISQICHPKTWVDLRTKEVNHRAISPACHRQKLPRSMAITHFYSQKKETWTEDYMNITWENTKARLRVGMLVRAAFTEGKTVTSDNVIWVERWYCYSYHGPLKGTLMIIYSTSWCQRPGKVTTSSKIERDRKKREQENDHTLPPWN